MHYRIMSGVYQMNGQFLIIVRIYKIYCFLLHLVIINMEA